jgi:arylsulfatase A-like enzyme
VFAVPRPFLVGSEAGTDHGSPYNYDTHVPLAFYGIPFQPGSYRTHAEPVDLAVTLASLLGLNPPTSAIGRVLNEAITPAHRTENSSEPPDMRSYPSRYPGEIRPAVLLGHEGPR